MSVLRKVLLVTHNFPPIGGGISVYSWEMAHGLARLGVRVRVVTPAEALEHPVDAFEVINFRENVSWGKARRVAILPPLRRSLLEWRPDLVFSISLHPYGFFVRTLAGRLGIPYVLGAQGSDVWRLVESGRVNFLVRWMEKAALRGAKRVFCASRYMATMVQKCSRSPADPVIIPNGVDTRLFAPGPVDRARWSQRLSANLEGKFLLCSVATLFHHKGHRGVLQALSLLGDRKTALLYVIVGRGPEEGALKNQVRKLNLNDQVIFLGPLEHREIPDLLRLCDLFVLNCQEQPGEAFGLAFLEANACGLPVIGGNVGGVPDTIRHSETGLLVDPENPAELAQAITRLMDDAELRHSMGQNGRRWAEEHDWSRLIPRYLAALEEILA